MRSPQYIATSSLCLLLAAGALAQSPDWTGGYVGAEIGYAHVDTNAPGISGDGTIGGIIAGYDHDLGAWVIGAGVDYDFADINLTGLVDLESVWRIRLRGGYKIENGLIYGTGGFANADLSTVGDDDGLFIGAGYEHLVNQNFSIGGEVLYHQFDNFAGSTADIDVTTVQVRGTLRF